MSTRSRPSHATPASSRRPTTDLPTYEPPSFPLNPAAQRALDQLARAYGLKKLDERFVDAQQALSVTAGEINDRLTEKTAKAKKRKAAVEADENDDDAANVEYLEKSLAELRDKIERMTQRMDDGMRKMIDGQHSVQAIRESLAATATDARANASTQASTQARSTQRRRTQGGDDDADEGDEEYQDFTPTDPTGGTQAPKAASETFNSKLDDSKTRYQSHTLTERYAQDNNYVNFRRIVHDARHPEGDVPLPPSSTWFDEDGGAPAPGVTTRAKTRTQADDDEDSDDDIAVSKTTISTKCPLTLTEFTHPLTSTKCPHSFERDAILSMLAPRGARGGGAEREVQCPVGGCAQMLSRKDLRVDDVLVRQIRRIQRARELEGEEQGGGTGVEVVGDEDEGLEDVDDIVEGRTQVKGEMRGSAVTGRGGATQRATQIVELESEDEDEEAEEDDGEETLDGE